MTGWLCRPLHNRCKKRDGCRKMNSTANQILSANAEAAKILGRIKDRSPESYTDTALHMELKRAICCRLQIDPEEADTDVIRNLCILNIRKQSASGSGLSDGTIGRQIEKYDCHQTNLVTQKKVLLMLYIEKTLGIRLEDDQAAEILTVRDLAAAVKKCVTKDQSFVSA